VSEKVGSIGVPSVKGMRDSFTDFAIGAGGGLAYSLTQALFGSGLLGALAAPVIAGSMVKGTRGTALATVAGFMLLSGAFGAGQVSASSSTGQREVM